MKSFADLKLTRKYRGMFRSKASGQRAFIKSVVDGHVFFQLEPSGSLGNMPLESFERQYRKERKSDNKKY